MAYPYSTHNDSTATLTRKGSDQDAEVLKEFKVRLISSFLESFPKAVLPPAQRSRVSRFAFPSVHSGQASLCPGSARVLVYVHC